MRDIVTNKFKNLMTFLYSSISSQFMCTVNYDIASISFTDKLQIFNIFNSYTQYVNVLFMEILEKC